MSDLTEIKFYHSGKNVYYEFTNFYQGKPINFPLTSGYENLQGQWKTAEHLFQAAGFRDRKNIVEQFRNLNSPREAFGLKRTLFNQGISLTDGRKGWDGTDSGSWENDGRNAKKIAVMRMVVEHKFRQDDYLKNLLLQTGDKKIIEDTKSDTLNPETKRDDCWGNATLYERDDKGRKIKSTGKEGKNWLGKILMELRTKLKNERIPDPPPSDPLADLKNTAITQINQEMSKDPQIETLELENQDWENSIQRATERSQIVAISNEVKADINAKREKKIVTRDFQLLISQAQQAMQTSNSLTLNQLLLQIYNYREHSRLYSQHENEIEQWENYVNQQDSNSFKILKISAINHLLQQEPKVAVTELREFNRGFQRIISQTSDFAKINNFESIVSDNVVEVRTEKRFDQILVNARNAKSEEEKSLVIQEIYKWRDTTNKWESRIWQQRKAEAEAFLNKWSSDKNNTEDESRWLKQTFQIVAVGISLVLVIWLLAKLVKRGRKF